ncbi:MAG: hypothetical protein ACJ735_04560 [Actinomycetes bacterium]
MSRVAIRSVLAALSIPALAGAVLAWPGAGAGFAAQPHPTPEPQQVAAATAPGTTPRLLAPAAAYLAPPRTLRVRAPHHPRPRLVGSPRTIGRQLAADRGWTGRQWECLDLLWTRESGWHVHEENASSGAYGIPQSLPAAKMAAAGSDWRDSAVTQIRWGLSYISATYGAPCGAWAHSQAYGYY